MASRQDLENALQNPNVRKMLDVIASAEGVKHGYNTIFGNSRLANLSAHPNLRKKFTQTDGRENYTTAAGRYQFLNKTWNNLAKTYGLDDFSPKNQDLGAVALIAGRGALNDVLNGNFKGAIGKLGSEWASLPTSTFAQGKRSWNFINKQLGSNNQGNLYEPEMVPKNMIAAKSNYEPELVPKSMMQTTQIQQQVYEPELVPANMMT
jgi:hypothetical protein